METLQKLTSDLDGALIDLAGRPPEAERKGYRPMPLDFAEMFPRLTWDAAKLHWRVHGRTMARWVDQAGRDKMKLARLAYRRAHETIESRERRRRYLAGKTRTRVGPRDGAVERVAAMPLIEGDSSEPNGG